MSRLKKIYFVLIIVFSGSSASADLLELGDGVSYLSECEEFMTTGESKAMAISAEMSLPAMLVNPYLVMKSSKLHNLLSKAELTYSMFVITNLRILNFPPEQLRLETRQKLYDIAQELYKKMSYDLRRRPNNPSLKDTEKSRNLFFTVPEKILLEKLFENLVAIADNHGALTLDNSSWFSFWDKIQIRQHQQQAELMKNVTPAHIEVPLYTEVENGRLLNKVQQISDQLDYTIQSEHNTSSLLTFGSSVLNLHKELIDLFTKDLMKWMPVYDSEVLNIRRNLKLVNTGKKNSIIDSPIKFNLLVQILAESSDSARLAMDVSLKVTKALTAHLAILNRVDQTNFSTADKIDWARQSELLSLALLTQQHFASHLNEAYLAIATLANGLNRVSAINDMQAFQRLGHEITALKLSNQQNLRRVLTSLELNHEAGLSWLEQIDQEKENKELDVPRPPGKRSFY